MASQLQFEGPVLEDLLERVRAEVGPDARIVAANRVRKGGVGGFFAKEGFEVVVDAARTASDRARRRRRRSSRPPQLARRAPTSVLDLAEEVNAIERDQVIDLVASRDACRPNATTSARCSPT